MDGETLKRNSRRELLLTLSGAALIAPVAQAIARSDEPLSIVRAGSNPVVGTPDHFTGAVRVTSAFKGTAPSRVGGAFVTFEPAARTFWHSHPLGQALVVTEGTGFLQHWGSSVQEIRPGDVVWIPPDVKHWHGAGPHSGMTHFAISEALNGRTVDWLEKAADDPYPK